MIIERKWLTALSLGYIYSDFFVPFGMDTFVFALLPFFSIPLWVSELFLKNLFDINRIGDGQTNPAEFEKFWKKKNKYDAILGNRVVRGDGKGRKFVENTVCFLLRLIFGVKVKDANAPFRLKTNNRCELLKECIEV